MSIVGAGLGGLSAAIHARLAGFDVTVFEKNPRAGGRANLIERDGYRFDVGPSLINYPWVFEDLFAAAGRRLSDYVELMPVEPTIRYVWPDGESLTLTSDLPALAEEFGRFEQGAAARLMGWLAEGEARFDLVMRRMASADERSAVAWLRRVGPGNLIRSGSLRSMRAELRRWFRSERILDALGSYAMYLGGSPWELPGAFSVLPYGEIAYGLWLPRGGVYALVEAIERLARDLGVEIRTGTEVTAIHVRDGKAVGVQTAGGSQSDSDVVVVNADAPHARARLLPGQSRGPRAPRMTPSVLTFYMALRKPPQGLGHHTIFLPEDSRRTFEALQQGYAMPDDPAFYTSMPSATDPGMAPQGHAVLFILVPVPLPSRCSEVNDAGFADRMRAQIMQRLAAHGVRLPDEDIVFEEHMTPRDWQDRFGLHEASAFGAAHTLTQIGPWRWPNADPAICGLYYVGASTVPGTGLPMVTLSGKMTVQRVLDDVR
jgi:phytoene desaturase